MSSYDPPARHVKGGNKPQTPFSFSYQLTFSLLFFFSPVSSSKRLFFSPPPFKTLPRHSPRSSSFAPTGQHLSAHNKKSLYKSTRPSVPPSPLSLPPFFLLAPTSRPPLFRVFLRFPNCVGKRVGEVLYYTRQRLGAFLAYTKYKKRADHNPKSFPSLPPLLSFLFSLPLRRQVSLPTTHSHSQQELAPPTQEVSG